MDIEWWWEEGSVPVAIPTTPFFRVATVIWVAVGNGRGRCGHTLFEGGGKGGEKAWADGGGLSFRASVEERERGIWRRMVEEFQGRGRVSKDGRRRKVEARWRRRQVPAGDERRLNRRVGGLGGFGISPRAKMATLRFSSPPTLLHNPIDFYSATVSSPTRRLSLSSANRSREVPLRSRSNGVNQNLDSPKSGQWRTGVSFFSSFLVKNTEIESLKRELLEAIAPLDRGAAATPEDQQRVDKIARKLEAINKVKEPLK
ncbi:putative plastid-lipid-associated protein 4, chloroplastic [Sesamum alatum]|uniref:Plastid-lipid-associated protein 4, chloroplastic n=1 Tax=Sesamum alatum TaxID=300844 RepID=A0AAE1Y6S0_9LAMI|nr:putative plastid-lipid-associated protein 4, chloroplastic [Sesamum alatum]